ncbi:MAG: XrtA system polysaccharide deacetylase [Thermogutta sp.]
MTQLTRWPSNATRTGATLSGNLVEAVNLSLINALTFDVEDYFHVSGFEAVIKRSQWDQFPSRVVPLTEKILTILAECGIHATFFILGWVAARFPKLVQLIHNSGHQIGSHSMEHRLVYRLTPDKFRRDLRQSLDVLQEIVGERVTCFRAPSFSITKQSLWALGILAEEGITCDSSIYPVVHDRYGIPGARLEPHRIRTESGMLWEFPGTALSWMGTSLPLGGGGYLRLYPLWMTTRLFGRVIQRGRPVMMYVHPWELDPEQPRIRGVSAINRFRHYVNLASTEKKLRALLQAFSWGSLEESLLSWQNHCVDADTVVPLHMIGC